MTKKTIDNTQASASHINSADPAQHSENEASPENNLNHGDDTTQETNAENPSQSTQEIDQLADDTDNLLELENQISALQQQVDDNLNRYLSARAEADNIQKRAQRDIENAHKYALEKALPDFINIKDALELGTQAAKTATQNTEQAALDKFIEGSEMAIRMFHDSLTKLGVIEVNPQNEAFNPEHHQAMSLVETDEIAPNHIIDVIQKGYLLNERLLRPAMVIVSKKITPTDNAD
ncbi:nucleotide exchange factor GrpE [Ostreibacterium oceani]|uniref:Protein GrpE n=1 Tax=Ostreibacterium oceani TaxID=2654998 RepID=A0A6N7EXM0_9GAMM|nr:nucleotide exchange factor GrpE [Ostreibacterium oceani]MPV85877.1 nucleotide exchange factor GrpE [Ostreibacterium oceani]